MPNLKRKRAFVTGASSGIGRATATALAKAGADVLVCARRTERIQELAESLKAEFNVNSFAVALDVRDREAVSVSLASLPEDWDKLDILVNNAGLSRGLDALQNGSLDDWDEMIDTNLKGLLYVTRAILPGMIERRSGHIVNIGSVAGHEVYPAGNVYCATKHAVDAITKGMRIDTIGTGVRVTTIDPGLVETEFSEVRFHGETERAAKVYSGMTPLTPEDVADAVLWSLSRPARVQVAQMILLPSDQATATNVNRQEAKV